MYKDIHIYIYICIKNINKYISIVKYSVQFVNSIQFDDSIESPIPQRQLLRRAQRQALAPRCGLDDFIEVLN